MNETLVCGIMKGTISDKFWTVARKGNILYYLQEYNSLSLALQNLTFDYISKLEDETYSVSHTVRLEPQ